MAVQKEGTVGPLLPPPASMAKVWISPFSCCFSSLSYGWAHASAEDTKPFCPHVQQGTLSAALAQPRQLGPPSAATSKGVKQSTMPRPVFSLPSAFPRTEDLTKSFLLTCSFSLLPYADSVPSTARTRAIGASQGGMGYLALPHKCLANETKTCHSELFLV